MVYEINPAPLYANGIIVASKNEGYRVCFCAVDRIDLLNTLDALGLAYVFIDLTPESSRGQVEEFLNRRAHEMHHLVLDYPSFVRRISSGEPPSELNAEETIAFAKTLQWIVPVREKVKSVMVRQ